MREAMDDQTLGLMSAIFARHPGLNKVVLYGSRAKGTHHERSDIDLALVGERLDRFAVGSIQMDLDDLDIPWQTDVRSYHDLRNPALLAHIDRVGQVIWMKS